MKNVVVITQAWPAYHNGSSQALFASLRIYCQCFDTVHYLALTDSNRVEELEGVEACSFHQIILNKQSERRRFLQSIHHKLPSITHQFTRRRVLSDLRKCLSRISGNGEGWVFIYEHLAPCATWLKLKKDFPMAEVCFRSHDVLTSAFAELAQRSRVGMKQLLGWEVRRIKRFEAAMFEESDRVWAITQENQQEYREDYGLECDGVIGVEIDVDRYRNVEPGSASTVLHLGGHDIRKMQGLRHLIHNVWPVVRARHPEAKLRLGGGGSEVLDDPAAGIEGLGFVEDEAEFLSSGAIFVNPQESGSGIKLKSLNALAAGKVLVSKRNGVQGVGGKNHKHYWAADTDEEMAEYILKMMDDEQLRIEVAQAGVALINKVFSRNRFEEKVYPIIRSIADGNSK